MHQDQTIDNGPLTRGLIRAGFWAADSLRYQAVKAWVCTLLTDPDSPRRRDFDLFMIALVVLSLVLLVYSVKNPLPPLLTWFEELAISIFMIEYLLRAWVYSDMHAVIVEHVERARFLGTRFRPWPALREALLEKWRYARSPLAIIDLLAILPSYRPIRLLRVFLLFRLFKLFRYAQGGSIIAEVLSEKRFEIGTLLLFVGFMVVAGSSAIYLFEADLEASEVNTFFDAVYWSVVTLSTVGYGDITPITTEGRFVATVVIFSGIGVFAFSTSIVVSAFQEKIGPMRDRRVLADLARRRGYVVVCGYGRMAEVVVDYLVEADETYVIIERDPGRVHQAVTRGHPVVQGDATNAELMARVGLGGRAGTVLCVTGDDVANVFITISARGMSPDLTIIARANRRSVIHKLELAGADHVVAPFQMVGLVGAEYAARPVAFDAFRSIIGDNRDTVLEGIRLPVDCPLAGRPLAGLKLDACRLVLFGIIRDAPADADIEIPANVYPLAQGWFHYNPPPEFTVRARDLLVVFGHEYSVAHFNQLLESAELRPGEEQ